MAKEEVGSIIYLVVIELHILVDWIWDPTESTAGYYNPVPTEH